MSYPVKRQHGPVSEGLLDHALWYSQRKWPVIPLHPRGKKPIGRLAPNGHLSASTDTDVIKKWWRDTPTANIGVPTGQKIGVVVLDVDGPDGEESLETLVRKFGPLPDTVEVLTGGGGRHLYFDYPTEGSVQNRVGICQGIDIRADGGYVVAPPSIHESDRKYEFELSSHPSNIPLAQPPFWLLDLAQQRTPSARHLHDGSLIPQGRRDTTIYRIACSYRAQGMEYNEILERLLVDNHSRCQPPLKHITLEEKVRSACKYRPGAHRGIETIDASNRDLPEITARALNALIKYNEPARLFRFGGQLMCLDQCEAGDPALNRLDKHRLHHELARASNWVLPASQHEKVAPPMVVVQDLLAMPNLPLPVLKGIIKSPVFGADGTLIDQPGFHSPSGLYFSPAEGFVVPPVSPIPSAIEMKRAVDLILGDLLGDFPFVSHAERAHAVAVLLLPFARELIDSATPLHLIEKPTPGTGASLLANVLSIPSIGQEASVMTEGRDEDEWRKRITSKLRNTAGAGCVLLDNLKKPLESGALAAAITTPVWEDRLLGSSEMIRISVRCVWMATGNNPVLSGEMTRRSLRIRLDAKHHQPWLRDNFRHANLHAWALENRHSIIWAALTLIRAWLAAGRPAWEGPRLGMFEAYSSVMGGILNHAGITGFLGNLEEFYEAADFTEDCYLRFIRIWRAKHQEPVGASALFKIASSDDVMIDLGSGQEQSQKTKLGRLLRDLRGRRFRMKDDVDVIVEEDGKKGNAKQWRLQVCK